MDCRYNQWGRRTYPQLTPGAVPINQSFLSDEGKLYLRARDLFDRQLLIGQLKGMWARIRGKQRHLAHISTVQRYAHLIRWHRLERQPIRVERIIGTEGRTDRFDCEYYPIDSRLRWRWVSVATGMMDATIIMPPIEVLQVGEDYYVVDGHHRVSVARALGYLYIDSEVLLWELEPNDDETQSLTSPKVPSQTLS